MPFWPTVPHPNRRSYDQFLAHLDRTSTDRPPLPADADIEKPPRSPTPPHVLSSTLKRTREAQAADSEARKTREDRLARARHLDADYSTPLGAQTFKVAGTREEEELRQTSGGIMFGRPKLRLGSGLHRPINTLNEQRYNANLQTQANGTGRRLPPPGLPTERSKGANVRPAAAFPEDGFRGDHERSAKRQKTTVESPASVLSNEAIDLTEDSQNEKHFGAVVGRKSLPWDTQPQNRLMSKELQNIDQLTGVRQKRRRRSKDGSGSSQASARDTPNSLQIETKPNQRRMRELYAVEIPANGLEDDVQEVSVPKRPGEYRSHGPKDSVDRSNTQKSRGEQLTGKQDITAANNILDSAMKRKPDAARSQQRRDQNVSDRPRTARQQETDDDFQFKFVGSQQPAEPLRHKFSRTSPEPPTRTAPRARERMKESSAVAPKKVSPITDAVDSDDELAGERTVPNSRSQSPQKTHASTRDDHKRSRQNETNLESDPSYLRPTRFKSKAQSQAQQTSQDSEIIDGMRIRVRAVMSRGCFVQESDDMESIHLVWHSDMHAFSVEVDDIPQKLPHKLQMYSIGAGEAQQWVGGAEWDELTMVHLKGASTAMSNGHILIDFYNFTEPGPATCFRYLQHATNGLLKDMKVSKEKMEHIVSTQIPLIQQVHTDYLRQAGERQRDAELAAMNNRKMIRDGQSSKDEERIKYEGEPAEVRQVARSQIQPDILKTDIAGASNRRSSRQQKSFKPKSPTPPPPTRWTHENRVERWSHSVVYPSEGARRCTVDFQDIERLDEGEFLNDNLISFAMRRIEEDMAPEQKENVHFFNSFFYTALTTKNGKRSFNYDAVKRWTKSKDLFSIPYVVVPINIDFHWFVAIICNLPNLLRKPSTSEDCKADEQDEVLDDPLQTGLAEKSANSAPVDVDAKTRDTQNTVGYQSISDDEKGSTSRFDEQARAHDASTPITSSKRPSTAGRKNSGRRTSRGPRKFNPDAPTIITLDSFGSSHATAVRNLKDYLNAESDAKRGIAVDPKDVQGMTAKGVPEQTNFCDCGVYVVGYVEEFAKDPKKFVTKVLQKELDQKADFANFDPSDKRAKIRGELLELHELQKGERRAKKPAKKIADKVNAATLTTVKPADAKESEKAADTVSNDAIESKYFAKRPEDYHERVKSPADAANVSMTTNLSGGAKEAGDELEAEVPRAFESLASPGHTTKAESSSSTCQNEE